MTVARVDDYRGVPTLFIDDVPRAPIVYFSAVPHELYVSEFANAGIHIYSWGHSQLINHSEEMGWEGPKRFDYSRFDMGVHAILRGDPRAYVFPRLAVSPPKWWYDLHPDQMNVFEDGSRRGVCMASNLWIKETSEAVIKLIERVKESSYADHVIGYQLTGGGNEWFYWGSCKRLLLPDYSSVMLEAFREWLRVKYGNDVLALRASWNADVDFETATIPGKEERLGKGVDLFRDPKISRWVMDYLEFFNETDANALEFCKIGNEATKDEPKYG